MAPPKRLWRPVEGCAFSINAPLLVPVEVETEIKYFSKLSNAFHFVELQDLRDRCSLSLCCRQ